MSGVQQTWRLLEKAVFAAILLSCAIVLRFVVGMDAGLAALVVGLIVLPFIVLRVRHDRRAGKARLRVLMEQKLAEPIWVNVVGELLALVVVVAGTAILTRDTAFVDAWLVGRVMAEVLLLGAPLIIAVFIAMAYWERRSAAAWLAREADA